MKILYYIVVFILLLQTQAYSQNKDKATNDKAIKEADKKFDAFSYVDAREVYLDVAKSGYKSENLFKKLGDSYYLNNELSNSLEWYEKLYNFQKNIGPEYLFRYSMALKSVKKYDEANKILQEYHLELNPNYDVNNQSKKSTQQQLMALNRGKFTTEKTSINSEYSDYSPAYYGSNLVFSSNRKNKEKSDQLNHNWNNQPFSDLYMVVLKKDNQLDNKIERFSDIINSPYHESSPVFTKDGKTMYFTRNNYTNNKYKTSLEGVTLLKIYKSTKGDDGNWQEPIALSFNSDEYSCAHPALSVDENKLYFSSDMTGTLGMSDLYVVDIKSDGSYGTPENMGDQINTMGRESYPYISNKNQLFFSSDGYDSGLGGFDVYVTDLKDYITVSEIINLGTPINSSTDDISFIIDTKDNTGFFASNRNNVSGSDDIYSFKLASNLISACKQDINGNIKDISTKKSINNVTVTLLDINLNLLQTTTTNSAGEFKFKVDCNTQYIIRTLFDDYEITEKTVLTDFEHGKINQINIPIQHGDLLGKSTAKEGDDLAKTLQLDPIYFDFDQSYIRPDAEVELQKIISYLRKNKNISIDVRSHTDSQGSSDYNLKLSQKRAVSTMDYFVKKGISQSRLKGKGYGDTRLVNKCRHGVICSEDEHQLNRRSEFIVFGSNNNTSDIIDTNETYIEEPVAVISAKNNNVAKNDSTEQIVVNKSDTASSNLLDNKNNEYDFTSTKEIYTVQIGALSNPTSDTYVYDGVNVFNYRFSDGFVRYFSGIFNNMANAQAYKEELIIKGLSGIFVVKLKGDKRILN